MRPYILAETNWSHLEEGRFELAVLPWGATEAHNYHLPYGTDNMEGEYIAAEAARLAWERGGRVVVLPNIPFGVNTGQSDIYLDMNMNPGTQVRVLEDIVEVLNRQGLYKLVVLNGHGGNDFKPAIRELGLKYPDMFISNANWFEAVDLDAYFGDSGDHAGEMETSLMLYLEPGMVLPREKWGKGRARKPRIRAFREKWLWAERPWSKVTADTGIGNPGKATREKGERFFRDVTQKLGEVLYELCKADPRDLYE